MKDWKLTFKNTQTGKGMVIGHYKTKKEATELKAKWDKIHEERNIPMLVTVSK